MPDLPSFCEKSELGNCGPDASGDYCLCHKPNKSESESAEFYEHLLSSGEATEDPIVTRFQSPQNLEEYHFPEPPEDRPFPFQKAQFNSEVTFDNAVFELQAIFKQAKFEQGVSFKHADFKSNVDFTEADFDGETKFRDVTFCASVEFRHAALRGHVDFRNAICKDRIEFWDVTVTERIYFRGTVFAGPASFQDTQFNSMVDFRDAEFRSDLSFFNTNFNQSVLMEYDSESPKDKYLDPSAEQESCRIQKLAYEREGMNIEADQMFVREMRAQRGQKHSIAAIIEWVIADLSCKYGTSWRRVLAVSGFHIFLFSVIYRYIDGTFGSLTLQPDPQLFGFFTYLYYSTVTFTTLGYGDISPVGPIMSLLSAIEALIGALLTALIIVVFGRKWMR